MTLLGAATAALVSALASPWLATAQLPPPGPFGGKLFEAVTFGAPLDPSDIPGGLPAADRTGVETYIARRAAFRSRLPEPEPASGPARAQLELRRRLEREIVALLDLPGIEEEAARVAEGAPLAEEPQALLEVPLREAAWAEDYLRRNPDGIATPFLYVFLAGRYRLAFDLSQEDEERRRMAKKYRTFLERVRTQPDGLFRLIAQDLDGRTFSGRPGPHPRQYLPDS
jgi:hypothetical protein